MEKGCDASHFQIVVVVVSLIDIEPPLPFMWLVLLWICEQNFFYVRT